MGILDLIIILFLLFGVLLGFKQGFTKTLVDCLGYIIIVILAFILKNPLSEFMMLHLPFFDFYGLIKGISVLNIAVYEVMAFGLIFSILLICLKLLMTLTSIFEKILSFTIILGVPSKILGMIFGFIKNYIIVFVALFILSLPNFSNSEVISNSNLKKPILEKTPILSQLADKTLTVFDEFISLEDKYKNTSSSNEFNYETLELFLKYDIVKASLVQKLVDKDKLHINGAENLIEKYGEE